MPQTAAYPSLMPGGNQSRVSISLSPRCYHSGGVGPIGGTVGTTLSSGSDLTPVVTETYMTEILVLHTCIARGIAVKNGSVAGTDKLVVALLDSAGTVLANSALAGTTASGTSSYQALPFTSPVQLRPGIYYIAEQANGTTTRIAAHTVGAFAAGKATSTVFGTVTGLTPPITFTTALGPMASLY